MLLNHRNSPLDKLYFLHTPLRETDEYTIKPLTFTIIDTMDAKTAAVYWRSIKAGPKKSLFDDVKQAQPPTPVVTAVVAVRPQTRLSIAKSRAATLLPLIDQAIVDNEKLYQQRLAKRPYDAKAVAVCISRDFKLVVRKAGLQFELSRPE